MTNPHDQPGWFDIGTVVNAHGIRGEVRVMPSTDDPERFAHLSTVDLFRGGTATVYPLAKAWLHKNFVILQLAGVNDRDAAMALVGSVIKIPPALALPLDEDEYYRRDLLDMEVFTESDEPLGIITEILQTGANDVYVVRANKSIAPDILIPAIKQCVLSVSVPEKRMTVRLMEGMR